MLSHIEFDEFAQGIGKEKHEKQKTTVTSHLHLLNIFLY